MPGMRQQESTIPIDVLTEAFINRVERKMNAKKVKKSNGAFFRRIEQLAERKQLKDDITDYEWDDV